MQFNSNIKHTLTKAMGGTCRDAAQTHQSTVRELGNRTQRNTKEQ